MVSLNALVLFSAISGVGETVLIEFTSENCGPCRNVEPVIRQLQADGYPIRQINVSRSPLWAEKYRVQVVPTFVMVSNGQVVDRVEGFSGTERLLQMFTAAGFRPAGSDAEQLRAQSPDSSRNGLRIPNFFGKDTRETPQPKSTPSLQPVVAQDVPEGSSTASQPRPASAETGISLTAEQRAARATVRLKVEDPRGYSFGTGTIIDTHGDEALVITCGHIFRDSRGQGRITIDLFVDGTPRSVSGEVITYDATTNDIGLVMLRPGVKVVPVPVAPSGYQLVAGAKVFNVGCNNGRPPSLIQSQITSVDRYVGPPNIQVAGMPVNGRSGGGLFTADGMLIGICNAADDQDNEGIYAALGVIHQKLAEIGQSRVFQPSQQGLAQASEVPAAATSEGRLAANPAGRSPATGLAGPATPVSLNDLEIICIVRSRTSPQNNLETLVLDHPSTDLLMQLRRESQANPVGSSQRQSVATAPGGRSRPRGLESGEPILRGQSLDR